MTQPAELWVVEYRTEMFRGGQWTASSRAFFSIGAAEMWMDSKPVGPNAEYRISRYIRVEES